MADCTDLIERIDRLMDLSQRWLDIDQACEYAKMGRTTLLKALRDGHIGGRKRELGGWIVDRRTIDAYNAGCDAAGSDEALFNDLAGRAGL